MIPRRAFLTATTAFTSINLYGAPSAPITADSIGKPRWDSVWFRPKHDAAAQQSKPAFALDTDAIEALKRARGRAGEGLKGDVTVHIVPDQDRDFFG